MIWAKDTGQIKVRAPSGATLNTINQNHHKGR